MIFRKMFSKKNNDMELFENTEKYLQEQLKKSCDSKGKELHLNESAAILNEMGLLYRSKSPDKISLIQSAALLNAAIFRQPSNQKFQNDLIDLCKHVITCAKATPTDTNLLDISKTVAEQVEKMRNTVRFQLKKIKQISEKGDKTTILSKETHYTNEIKFLQKHVLSTGYKNIMANISQQCIKIMGKPPCKYALVGMGSLARDEITPYSDFEHALVMENFRTETMEQLSSSKEYFRWYSVLFHIIVINLQETIIPSVCIPCLNDSSKPNGNWFYDKVTPRGISFDGMMSHACKYPLGRTQPTKHKPWTTELIKPIDEMVKYLEADEDLKNGYKLGDILTRTCFIEGCTSVYTQFSKTVILKLKQNQTKYHYNFEQQLKEDLKIFDVWENFALFSENKQINIKRAIYRSITLFISALGRFHCFNKNSGFEIIEEFQKKLLISDSASNRLSFAVAVACHVRLFYYMTRKRQDDNIHTECEIDGQEKLAELTKIVSKESLAKSLSVTYILQNMLRQNLHMKNFDNLLRSNYFVRQMTASIMLGLFSQAISIGENCLKNEEISAELKWSVLGDIAISCVISNQCKKYCEICKKHQPLIKRFDQSLVSGSCARAKLYHLYCSYTLDKLLLVMYETDRMLKLNIHFAPVLRIQLLHLNGICKWEFRSFNQAVSVFSESLKMIETLKTIAKESCKVRTLPWLSASLIAIGRKEQGLHLAREGLNYVEMIGSSVNFYKFLAIIIDKNTNHAQREENKYVNIRPTESMRKMFENVATCNTPKFTVNLIAK